MILSVQVSSSLKVVDLITALSNWWLDYCPSLYLADD